MKVPTAKEFLATFLQAYEECLPEDAIGRANVWKHWTAFMTGKEGKASGHWEREKVLPAIAKKFGLEYQREFLHLDVVFFAKGKVWGDLVAIEHENEIGRFKEEVEKLMSVLAPLKVGITVGKPGEDLERLICGYYNERHNSIREDPFTEYLFLAGDGDLVKARPITWYSLSFNCRVKRGDLKEKFHRSS